MDRVSEPAPRKRKSPWGEMRYRGVAAIPNRCSSCCRFKSWDQLVTHFVPDSDYSSESESWRECLDCRAKAAPSGEKGSE